jgi:hypothetical protein
MTGRARPSLVWLGAAAAPVCWFTQQVAMGAAVPFACPDRQWIEPLLWIVCGVPLIVAFAVSFRALRRVPSGDAGAYSDRRSRFVGEIALAMPVIFFLVMTWQAAASFTFWACER